MWASKFGQAYARQIHKRHDPAFEVWHLDEIFVNIGSNQMYLWRAVDGEDQVLNALPFVHLCAGRIQNWAKPPILILAPFEISRRGEGRQVTKTIRPSESHQILLFVPDHFWGVRSDKKSYSKSRKHGDNRCLAWRGGSLWKVLMDSDETPASIYLDYQGSTPVDRRVVDAMQPWWYDNPANPHARHVMGLEAAYAIESACEAIASLVGASSDRVTFTSGATESINLALRSSVGETSRLVTWTTEHDCTLAVAERIRQSCFAEVIVLPVGSDGLIDLDRLGAVLAERSALVSVAAVNNEIGVVQDIDTIGSLCRYDKGTARRHAIQVKDFYVLGEDTLWITFADGYLWWCIAAPGVENLGHDDERASREGSRLRHTISGWHNQSIGGKKLYMNELNGGLVQTQRFQGTVCDVKLFDYLLRKINDEELPEIIRGKEAREQACNSIEELMTLLTWRDFEILVDLIFSASGWRRIGESGGTQKTVDLELELPSTGERAFVQVKSQTNQAQLDEYIERFAGRDEGRMFYVYHLSKGELRTDITGVSLIGPERLSTMVLDAGLFGWLLRKVG